MLWAIGKAIFYDISSPASHVCHSRSNRESIRHWRTIFAEMTESKRVQDCSGLITYLDRHNRYNLLVVVINEQRLPAGKMVCGIAAMISFIEVNGLAGSKEPS